MFLGACVWPFIGRGFNRPYLGAFIGLLWFFMPNNLCAIFIEGNLARSLSMIFLPVFIYSVYKYLYNHKLRYIPLMVFTFLLMELCHLGYAGMVAIAVIIYGIVYMIQKGRKKAVLDVVISMIFGFIFAWNMAGCVLKRWNNFT